MLVASSILPRFCRRFSAVYLQFSTVSHGLHRSFVTIECDTSYLGTNVLIVVDYQYMAIKHHP